MCAAVFILGELVTVLSRPFLACLQDGEKETSVRLVRPANSALFVPPPPPAKLPGVTVSESGSKSKDNSSRLDVAADVTRPAPSGVTTDVGTTSICSELEDNSSTTLCRSDVAADATLRAKSRNLPVVTPSSPI